jgi:hypothetical protein
MASIDFEGEVLRFYTVHTRAGKLIAPFVLDSSRARTIAAREYRRSGKSTVLHVWEWHQGDDSCKHLRQAGQYPPTGVRPAKPSLSAS